MLEDENKRSLIGSFCSSTNQGPVAQSLVSVNRWLRGIKTYRFPWYLTLVSANHTSSNPSQVVCKQSLETQITMMNCTIAGGQTKGANEREILRQEGQNQVADQRFSLKQWFAGGAHSRGLREPGCGHCYLRFFQ